MKYMGSKRAMLKNGLGLLLESEVVSARRFVDLFAGSGAVASFVATRFEIPVLAVDLQHYSVVLADAVIGRDIVLDADAIWRKWHAEAARLVAETRVPHLSKLTRSVVEESRVWCANQRGVITKAYGGHYFSPLQAVWIDALRETSPQDRPKSAVTLAALIHAASKSAASPGHTAQPFQPSSTAKRFLEDAWNRDVVHYTRNALLLICNMHAKKRGRATISDANKVAHKLLPSDIAFIDPPYSGVHYSRFYHVLETIAVGVCGDVNGIGRYPDSKYRPRSQYSLRGGSAEAFSELLQVLSARGASAIVTFPDHDCSNGLSGDLVREIARQHFRVRERSVKSTFSTLGGTQVDSKTTFGRAARHHTEELMLVLRPKSR